MLTYRNAVAGLGFLAATTLGAGAVAAAPVHGYVTTGLNLRAGPSTNYPVVTTMRGGDSVTIFGCMSRWSWCDIGWHGYRGWAAGQYLQVDYHQRRRPITSYGHYYDVPSISFSIGTYWNRHYHDRSFFSEMDRFGGGGSDRHNRPRRNGGPNNAQPPSNMGQPPTPGNLKMPPGAPCPPGTQNVNGTCQ